MFLQGLEANDLAAGLQFPHGFFQRFAVVLRFEVQQPHFQNIVNARPKFGHIERLADEILGAGFERAQLVARLRGDHQDRQIAVAFDLLQPFHHLESIHAGHLEIEQDQAVTILAVKFADLRRIGRRVEREV